MGIFSMENASERLSFSSDEGEDAEFYDAELAGEFPSRNGNPMPSSIEKIADPMTQKKENSDLKHTLLQSPRRGPSLHRCEVRSESPNYEEEDRRLEADDCACIGPWPDNDTLRVRCGQSWCLDPRCLGFIRFATVIYFFTVGIQADWSDTNWSHIPPPIFLTNWGFVTNTLYFLCATSCSIHEYWLERYLPPNIEPHAQRATWKYRTTWVLYELALTLETNIVIFYWTLVYTGPADKGGGKCDLICLCVHCAGLAGLWIDGFLNRHIFNPRHIYVVFIIPVAWLLVQFIWIKTGHPNCYAVLTFRRLIEIPLLFGITFCYLSTFYFYHKLLQWRQRFLYPTPEELTVVYGAYGATPSDPLASRRAKMGDYDDRRFATM